MQQDLGKGSGLGLAFLRNLPHCRQMCQASPFHIKCSYFSLIYWLRSFCLRRRQWEKDTALSSVGFCWVEVHP